MHDTVLHNFDLGIYRPQLRSRPHDDLVGTKRDQGGRALGVQRHYYPQHALAEGAAKVDHFLGRMSVSARAMDDEIQVLNRVHAPEHAYERVNVRVANL